MNKYQQKRKQTKTIQTKQTWICFPFAANVCGFGGRVFFFLKFLDFFPSEHTMSKHIDKRIIAYV